MIKIKTEKEIKLIRQSCGIVAETIRRLKECLYPGVSTKELDSRAVAILKELGAVTAFKGYHGYPGNICTSVNEEVVHGICSSRRLEEGDLITLDVGAKRNGYFGDAAWTFPIGKVSQTAERLLTVGKKALSCGIAKACDGNRLFDISSEIQSYVESEGFSVVRKFVGHGIGSELHEDPEIPNFGTPGQGPVLKAGMVLAIEPMINEGTCEVEILQDQWTVVTKDRKLSVHFEHTVCITKNGPEILTSWE